MLRLIKPGERTFYNRSNSGLPGNYVTSIAIDSSGNKWIGTWLDGLAKFDGTNWTVFDKKNSGLPDNYVKSIAIDGMGNKWIGTDYGGLTVYNESGVIVAAKDIKNSVLKNGYNIIFHQGYPITKISYSISKPGHISLTVFDIKGRILKNLVNTVKRAGNHMIDFDCRNMPSGACFVNLRVDKTNSVTRKSVILK